MRAIGADEGGISRMVDKALFDVVRVEEVMSPAANILKQEMLALGGDAAVARDVVTCRVDRSPLLLMGTRKQLKQLVSKIQEGPFGLSDIAREIADYIRVQESHKELQIKLGDRILDLSARSYIMGVLNVTPDSFYNGGRFLKLQEAIERAEQMVEEGVDIIDIGGESSRPGAEPLPLDQEVERVIPVIESLSHRLPVPISVDTYKAGVARRALDAGAGMVNDISALRFDPDMAKVVAEYDVPVVLMHMLGTPKTMQQNPSYVDPVGEIYGFLSERIEAAEAAHIRRSNIIIDPGIGFGKRMEDNLEILRRLREFGSLGCPLLIGPSRKSFIGKVLDLPVEERLEGTAAAVAIGIANGANILRVHDVREMVRVARIADAVK
ncbi:MAG TPA: dihydropteroate synthase [Candidatus Latescibacteria bacterium]|nr:dihydropteroate synthase [Candidatus Latescibacterota bacterium]